MASWRTDPTRVDGTWHCFRQVGTAWPALWHAAGEAVASQESARWHVQGEGYAQYLALSPLGAWAELVRYFSIRSLDLAAEQRRDLWLVYVEESDLADLSTFERWEACGLDPAHAVGEHARCQALAEELRAAGYRGVLAPSAALPGVVNLTLFGERYERVLYGGIDVWSNPDPGVFLPCTLAASAASPPGFLTTETCFRRAPHAGYRAYLRERGLTASSAHP